MARLWEEEIDRHLPDIPGLRILDIGTGSGFFAFLLEQKGHRVTGVDLTPSMIEEAEEIGRKTGAVRNSG